MWGSIWIKMSQVRIQGHASTLTTQSKPITISQQKSRTRPSLLLSTNFNFFPLLLQLQLNTEETKKENRQIIYKIPYTTRSTVDSNYYILQSFEKGEQFLFLRLKNIFIRLHENGNGVNANCIYFLFHYLIFEYLAASMGTFISIFYIHLLT